MKSIVLNYRITGDISRDRFNQILAGCYSSKYNVILNIYDFSISKNIENYMTGAQTGSLPLLAKRDEENSKISYIKRDFEEIENSEQIITENLIKYADSLALCILPEINVLTEDCIDSIDFEWMNDPINGFIYFDYSVNGIRCFLRSKGPNIQLNVPVLFWSMSKLINHISDKDKFGIITNNYTGIHIARNLCTVYQDDK